MLSKAHYGSLATLIVAALSCGGAQAAPLFDFMASPQAAPQAQSYQPYYAQAPSYYRQEQSGYDRYEQEQSNYDRIGDEDAQLPPQLQRQIVNYPTREAPGTIIVDTPHTYLYYVLGGGKAIRYGIGVGREGFTWSGVRKVARKAEWPDWYPPPEMIARQPYLPRMTAGGPGNPLGARAIYIGGTEYRIHGTNDPSTIGHHVSSGCIRLTNEDIIDLYNRVKVGAKVNVLPQAPVRTIEAKSRPRQVMPPDAPAPADRTHGYTHVSAIGLPRLH